MEYVALSRLKPISGLAILKIVMNRFIRRNIVYQPKYNEIYPAE